MAGQRINSQHSSNSRRFWCTLKGYDPVWRPKNSVISELENVDLYITGDSIDSQSQSHKSKLNTQSKKQHGLISPQQRIQMKPHENSPINDVTDFRYKNPLWVRKNPATAKKTELEKYESPQQQAIVLEHMNTLVQKRNSSLQKTTASSTPRYFGAARYNFNLTGITDRSHFPSSPKLGATNSRNLHFSEKRQSFQLSRRVLPTRDKLKPLLGDVSRASDLAAELHDEECNE